MLIGFVDFEDGLTRLRTGVLPRLEERGLRQPFARWARPTAPRQARAARTGASAPRGGGEAAAKARAMSARGAIQTPAALHA